jgi:hypothetical protein
MLFQFLGPIPQRPESFCYVLKLDILKLDHLKLKEVFKDFIKQIDIAVHKIFN